MKQFLITASAFFLVFSPGLHAKTVRDYQAFYATGSLKAGNTPIIALRKYTLDRKEHLLAVNPETLETATIRRDEAEINAAPFEDIRRRLKTTPYIQALDRSERNRRPLQNAGIVRVPSSPTGAYLTIDLCPSKHPLDRVLFTRLRSQFSAPDGPIPVAISITGRWMEEHAEEIGWLRNLEKEKAFSILWVNHSYHHTNDKRAPLWRNFMLTPKLDIEDEVLATEARMIEEELRPSIFFRFPGLISNGTLMKRIGSLGLVAVGSDAWLGKNQWPRNGSIVLVHANGNERVGIQRFFKLLDMKRRDIERKRWQMLDLRKSMAEAKTGV